jgi:putative toxin-antitoxin system antitoxin component (TIGR02293 family)
VKVSRLPAPGRKFSAWGSVVRKMPPAKKIAMIRQGVEVALLIGAGQYYGISQASLSRLIGVSDATVVRKIKAGGRLSPQESERLARIAAVEAEAEDVFDSKDLARRWMLEPHLALGEPPLSLLDTDAGAEEVRKVLASIAYGGAA